MNPIRTLSRMGISPVLAASCSLAALAAPAVVSAADAWNFDPKSDPYDDTALLDLSYLNEEVAGQNGFIAVSEDGESFVDGAGKPIRFWAVGSGEYRQGRNETKEQHLERLDRHCAFLAKRGVNMARLHTSVVSNDMDKPNRGTVEGIWRFVSVAKQHGIYTTISPYWAHRRMPKQWEGQLEGVKPGEQMWGLLFFNPRFQEAYKKWLKVLYTEKNPHTGIPLKDDAGVAIIQFQNEDSLLFHTFSNMQAAQKELLGRQFKSWLEEKYGSIDKVAAWNGETLPTDSGKSFGFYPIWELAQNGGSGSGKQERLNDQTEFLAWRMHTFNADIDDYLKNTLGCKQLTNAMNWKSGDIQKYDDAERWSYMSADVIAKNRYTGASQHQGWSKNRNGMQNTRGYRIDPGHGVKFDSVLRNPTELPLNLKQIQGRTMIITESTWVHPAKYQAEGGFLIGAYQSLSGIDAYYWFHAGKTEWDLDPRRSFWKVKPGPRGNALTKWECNVPQIAGMWPANALLYRLGYIAEGETVMHEERTLKDVFTRVPGAMYEDTTFDPNRDAVDKTGGNTASASQLTYLTGQVTWAPVDENPAEPARKDVSSLITPQTITSTTGELVWDYKTGLCTMNAPKAQGAAGFFADYRKPVELDSVTIKSANDYAAINVVSMDEKPLSDSKKVLIQFGSTVRLKGWETKKGTWKAPKEDRNKTTLKGEIIEWTGEPPWQITAPKRTTIFIANKGLSSAQSLDPNGYIREELAVKKVSGGVEVTLPQKMMYVIVQ